MALYAILELHARNDDDRIHERDRQTDIAPRHRPRLGLLTHSIAQQKALSQKCKKNNVLKLHRVERKLLYRLRQ